MARRAVGEQVGVGCGNVQVDDLAFLVLHYDRALVESLCGVSRLYQGMRVAEMLLCVVGLTLR